MALITTLPSIPNFGLSTAETDTTNYLNRLSTLSTEANLVLTLQNLSSTLSKSTQASAFTTGTKTFTVEAGKSYVPGMTVKIQRFVNAYMIGDVITYSGTTLTVDVTVLNINPGLIGATIGGTWTITQCSPGGVLSEGNFIITSLNGLTTALSISQGGTGSTSASLARTNLGIAASGVNTDITQITGLITPLSVTSGGTGGSTALDARIALGLQDKRALIVERYASGTTIPFEEDATENWLSLSNKIYDEIGITLYTPSGAFTLPAGTYIISAISEAYKTSNTRLILYDVGTIDNIVTPVALSRSFSSTTDSTTATAAKDSQVSNYLEHKFTIATSKLLRIAQFVEKSYKTAATTKVPSVTLTSHGVAGFEGTPEIYTQVAIRKVA